MTNTVFLSISRYTNITAKSSADLILIPNQHEISSSSSRLPAAGAEPGVMVKSGTPE